MQSKERVRQAKPKDELSGWGNNNDESIDIYEDYVPSDSRPGRTIKTALPTKERVYVFNPSMFGESNTQLTKISTFRKQSLDGHKLSELQRPNTNYVTQRLSSGHTTYQVPGSGQNPQSGKRGAQTPYLIPNVRKTSTNDLKNLMTFLSTETKAKYDAHRTLETNEFNVNNPIGSGADVHQQDTLMDIQNQQTAIPLHSTNRQSMNLLYMNSDRCLHTAQGVNQYMQLHGYQQQYHIKPNNQQMQNTQPQNSPVNHRVKPENSKKLSQLTNPPPQSKPSSISRSQKRVSKPTQNILTILQERKDLKKQVGSMINTILDSQRENDESINEFIKLEMNCLSDITQRKRKIYTRERNLKRKIAQTKYKIQI